MKKAFIILFILICTSGCWNYRELNYYSIVTGVAIDKGDENDKYELSLLISNSTKTSSDTSSPTGSKTVVYSGKGNSIFEAVKDIGLISPKELYLGHFLVLVVSEDVAKDGIFDILDFFLREPSSRKDFNIVIARDTEAKDTLKIIAPLSSYPSQNISDNLIYTNKLQGIVSNVNYNQLISTIITDGIEPTINSVYIEGNKEEGSSTENTESSEPKAYVKLGTLGVFKTDKLIDWASYDESLGINIINNNINEMYLEVTYEDSNIILNSISFKTKVDTKLENNKPIINIDISGDFRIEEIDGKINISDENIILELQKKMNDKIKQFVNKAINLADKNNTDIFGFERKFYENYPQQYEKIRDDISNNLKSIDVRINSHALIKSKGSTQHSLEEIDDKK